MKTNDLKSGTEVQLSCGDPAILADNKKGNVRMAKLTGPFGIEIGSIYSHDITKALINGKWHDIEHTSTQLKCKDLNDSIFGRLTKLSGEQLEEYNSESRVS